MAYEHYPSAWEAKESSEVLFSENEVPSAGNNYALCKVLLERSEISARYFYVNQIDVAITKNNTVL